MSNPCDYLDKHIAQQATYYGLTVEAYAKLFKSAADYDDKITNQEVEEP